MSDTTTYAAAEALAETPITAGALTGTGALLAALLSGSMPDGTDALPPRELVGADSLGIYGGFKRERVTSGFPTIDTDHANIHEGIAYSAGGSISIATAKTGSIRLTTPGPLTDVAASVTIDMTNALADITYTAKIAGAAGNDISVTHVDPAGNDQPLGVVVAGNAVTVNLATGPAGAITSTAADVVAAITAAVTAPVTATDEGVGSGVVEAKAITYLAGGTNNAYIHLKGIAVQSSYAVTVTLYEAATVTGTEVAVEPRNRKRSSADNSSVFVRTCTDATLAATTVALATAQVPAAASGPVIVGGALEAEKEWVLNTDGTYVIGIANASGSTAVVTFDVFYSEESAA